MAFGKKGRPAEDRLARQREIYTAVAPLIEREGARRLSMRQAAAAACLSIGGLYHYFPTKRELVLHGLCREAILRRCEDFHAQFEHLVEADPQQYIKEGIDLIVSHVGFCRPALHAAARRAMAVRPPAHRARKGQRRGLAAAPPRPAAAGGGPARPGRTAARHQPAHDAVGGRSAPSASPGRGRRARALASRAGAHPHGRLHLHLLSPVLVPSSTRPAHAGRV